MSMYVCMYVQGACSQDSDSREGVIKTLSHPLLRTGQSISGIYFTGILEEQDT